MFGTDLNIHFRTRQRTETTAASCGGTCGSLQEIRTCNGVSPTDCTHGAWSAWSACSNACGKGTKFRSRKITKSAICGGSCPSVYETVDCKDYSSSQDCKLEWGNWGSCSSKCSVGTKIREATVKNPRICSGKSCGSMTVSIISKLSCVQDMYGFFVRRRRRVVRLMVVVITFVKMACVLVIRVIIWAVAVVLLSHVALHL